MGSERSSQQIFLKELQHQATRQAELHKKRLLPAQLDPITSLIGNYPWQFLLIVSFLTTVGLWMIGVVGHRI